MTPWNFGGDYLNQFSKCRPENLVIENSSFNLATFKSILASFRIRTTFMPLGDELDYSDPP